jgi:hypothetical protein
MEENTDPQSLPPPPPRTPDITASPRRLKDPSRSTESPFSFNSAYYCNNTNEINNSNSNTPNNQFNSPLNASPLRPPCSPRLRPTAIIIPAPMPSFSFYSKVHRANVRTSSFDESIDNAAENDDMEMPKLPHNHGLLYDRSLVVLPTFYTPSHVDLVFCSNLHHPEIMIPENRTKTPRTPKTPQALHRKKLTRSPSDEMLQFTNAHRSPSELLRGKYKEKNQLLNATDFRI